MTTSAELNDRYKAVLPSFVHAMYKEPVSIERGEGSYVWDVEGRRYLDFFGGVLTTMVGHSVPEIVAAVQEQVEPALQHVDELVLVRVDMRRDEGAIGKGRMPRERGVADLQRHIGLAENVPDDAVHAVSGLGHSCCHLGHGGKSSLLLVLP